MVRSINNPDRSIEISGFCSPAFAAVKDAFYKNFTARGEVGASVSVTIRGETVVDLWGGNTIGMMGAGGATAFADPDLHLGFGYSMNAMDPAQSGRQRPQALVAALNSCLGR
ncbi:hypothetical protein [Bosea sp. (in: a-proteobacteria)]|uniref:hypothetical protein n=1 Tax=Bosea sp. (in: a-proteobacteria) TaxID=1871050 RepID=UPI0012244FA3|nr:hypothetical protein [Bosea sp. (in: a-proteobacteria)]TAJ27349.1 MAG: hypothetical protein EPO59_22090 [Bosea sp. (in: a-proteobacteria)]